MFEASIVFEANRNSNAKIANNQGGTYSGKTYSILQVLASLAVETSDLVITVVGQDIPNLKAGPIRDMGRIIKSSPILKTQIKTYNKTERTLIFLNGTIIEFKSYENEQDARSGKRDYLFINEANGISYDIFRQLQKRTEYRTFLDYNPSSSFWVHEMVLNNPKVYPSVDNFISDHRDNPFISDDMHESIERLKHEDIELWKVYARGLTGKIDGLIIKNWFICSEIPPDAKLIAYGLDFGFTNDETGAVEVYMQDGELWVNELIYKKGLTNPAIRDELVSSGISLDPEIICDSAEPKSIEELKQLGLNTVPAMKGPDSIKNGIDILKRYRINVTRNSLNLRMELGKYIWKKDRTGKTLNEPIGTFNHLIDPLRYVALNKLKVYTPREVDFGW
jgi:phage terminase large subunit